MGDLLQKKRHGKNMQALYPPYPHPPTHASPAAHTLNELGRVFIFFRKYYAYP